MPCKKQFVVLSTGVANNQAKKRHLFFTVQAAGNKSPLIFFFSPLKVMDTLGKV